MKKLYTIILLFVSIHLHGIESVQFPQMQFQSTSNCQTVTGYNPHITEVGATTVYNTYNYTPRRNNGKPGEGHPNDPYPTPIGDTPWLLMMVLIGFYIIIEKWKRMKSSTFNL